MEELQRCPNCGYILIVMLAYLGNGDTYSYYHCPMCEPKKDIIEDRTYFV